MNRFTRLSLATLLSLMSWMSAFSQGIVVEQSPTTDIEAQITHALAPLSMSPVTSGILLNRKVFSIMTKDGTTEENILQYIATGDFKGELNWEPLIKK